MLREVMGSLEIKKLEPQVEGVWLHRVDMEGEVVPLCSQYMEVEVHPDWEP